MNDLADNVLLISAVVTTLFFWQRGYSLTISLISGLALAFLYYPIVNELAPLEVLLDNTLYDILTALGKVIFLFCAAWLVLATIGERN